MLGAIDQAAAWLEDAGCVVDEVTPPRFDEAAQLWAQLVWDDYLDRLATRLAIAREWSTFFDSYPVLLSANSWERQFPIDDDQRSPERMGEILRAQSPLLSTAMLGLPGLSVPVGVSDGLPTGVQLVAHRFREDLLVQVGQLIEDRSSFNALEHLAPLDATS